MPILPTDASERKKIPIGTGVLDYFPDALAEVAKASMAGNIQHMNGEPLHWDRSKSQDEADSLIRHFMERDKVDSDGILHAAKMSWRALAYTQKLCEVLREKETKPARNEPHTEECVCSSSYTNKNCLIHGEKHAKHHDE